MPDVLDIDLTINPQYYSQSLDMAPWIWPVVVRVIVGLINHLVTQLASGQPLPATLLPHDIRIDSAGDVRINLSKLEDGAPFAAPEVLKGSHVSENSLVFSVGAIHYYLLTGRPPIGDVWQLENELPELPKGLMDVILRTLEMDLANRFEKLIDLRQALLEVLVPPAWWEAIIPRLPLPSDTNASLMARGNALRVQWLRIRDRLPWHQFGQVKLQAKTIFSQPAARTVITLLGMSLYLYLMYSLLTN